MLRGVVCLTPRSLWCLEPEVSLVPERRLAPSTIRGRERVARRFLEGHGPTAGESSLSITAAEVTAFLTREFGRLSPGSAGSLTSGLRSVLRYLATRGLADRGSADAVPRIAQWREATVPRFPTPAAVDALLASCDRSTVVGARDYAVLLLLARLGLRAIEVSRLELSDLDWRAGEIEVDGKAHHRGRLPLPADVGEAVVCPERPSRRRTPQQAAPAAPPSQQPIARARPTPLSLRGSVTQKARHRLRSCRPRSRRTPDRAGTFSSRSA